MWSMITQVTMPADICTTFHDVNINFNLYGSKNFFYFLQAVMIDYIRESEHSDLPLLIYFLNNNRIAEAVEVYEHVFKVMDVFIDTY